MKEQHRNDSHEHEQTIKQVTLYSNSTTVLRHSKTTKTQRSSNPQSPPLAPHSLLPPPTIRRTERLISRPNIRPDSLQRPMISRTLRRRRQLQALELINADNPQRVKVLHQFKIRPAASQRLATLVMHRVHMVQHGVPGSAVGGVDEPLAGTEGTARCAGGLVRAEVAQHVGSPVVGFGEGLVAVEDVEEADVCVLIMRMVMMMMMWLDVGRGWGDYERACSVVFEDGVVDETGCPSGIEG